MGQLEWLCSTCFSLSSWHQRVLLGAVALAEHVLLMLMAEAQRASLTTQAHFKVPACIISAKILLVRGSHSSKTRDGELSSHCVDRGRGEEPGSVIQFTVAHFLGHIYSCPSHRKYPYPKDPEKSHPIITSGSHGTPETNIIL